jgi:hypothetical protein
MIRIFGQKFGIGHAAALQAGSAHSAKAVVNGITLITGRTKSHHYFKPQKSQREPFI